LTHKKDLWHVFYMHTYICIRTIIIIIIINYCQPSSDMIDVYSTRNMSTQRQLRLCLIVTNIYEKAHKRRKR